MNVRSDPLYEAMKETLRSDKYKKYKVSVSSSRYLYKKDGPYFWSVHFTPQGAPQDGTLPIYLYLSLKYWRFDELQLAVTHPGAAPRFTDRSRCGGGACNAPIERGTHPFPWGSGTPVREAEHEELLLLSRNILSAALERVQALIAAAEKDYGGLGDYFIAHPEINPRLAGLALIDRGDYQGAEKVFSSIDKLPETLAFSVLSVSGTETSADSVWRNYRDIYLDYCRAMQRGIPWTEELVRHGLPD